MDYMDNVSKRIVSLREEKGETQQELANAIGITRQSLSRYEIAARTVNAEVLGALARHFGVSADYLLGLSDVRSTEQDMRTACEVTQLSEKAVKMLKDNAGYKEAFYQEKLLPILNAMLETKDFYRIIDSMNTIIASQKKITVNVKTKFTPNVKTKFIPKEMEQIFGIANERIFIGKKDMLDSPINIQQSFSSSWDVAPVIKKLEQAMKFQVEFEFRELYTKIVDVLLKKQEQENEEGTECAEDLKLSDFFEAIMCEDSNSEQEANSNAQHHETEE
ncbi:helix-turn-helix domain-containing protein [Ruminococcus sp.]